MIQPHTSSGAPARARTTAPAGARRRASAVLRALRGSLSARHVELDHRSPFELLVATILSAQSTDRLVNRVTPALFRRYPRAADLARARADELARLIRPTGYYRAKTRNLKACATELVERFQGQVPRTMEELVSLPGVGRKTANVVLGNAFGVPAIVVDTHVRRVAFRLGLTRHREPDRIERDLQRLIPPHLWTVGSQSLLLHGRYVCIARRPRCEACPIYAHCPWEGRRRR